MDALVLITVVGMAPLELGVHQSPTEETAPAVVLALEAAERHVDSRPIPEA